MSADRTTKALLKEIAGLHGLISRVAGALNLDTHPDRCRAAVEKFCADKRDEKNAAHVSTEGKTP